MKQKQPKFSGILVVAVLMVLVLFIVSLSPLLAASGSKDTTYSEIYYYFENQQVTSFRLDLGTGSLELWLKAGKAALPESNAAASLPTGGQRPARQRRYRLYDLQAARRRRLQHRQDLRFC